MDLAPYFFLMSQRPFSGVLGTKELKQNTSNLIQRQGDFIDYSIKIVMLFATIWRKVVLGTKE